MRFHEAALAASLLPGSSALIPMPARAPRASIVTMVDGDQAIPFVGRRAFLAGLTATIPLGVGAARAAEGKFADWEEVPVVPAPWLSLPPLLPKQVFGLGNYVLGSAVVVMGAGFLAANGKQAERSDSQGWNSRYYEQSQSPRYSSSEEKTLASLRARNAQARDLLSNELELAKVELELAMMTPANGEEGYRRDEVVQARDLLSNELQLAKVELELAKLEAMAGGNRPTEAVAEAALSAAHPDAALPIEPAAIFFTDASTLEVAAPLPTSLLMPDDKKAKVKWLERLDSHAWGQAAEALATIAAEASEMARVDAACDAGVDVACAQMSKEEEAKRAWLAQLNVQEWNKAAVFVSEIAAMQKMPERRLRALWLEKLDASTWGKAMAALSTAVEQTEEITDLIQMCEAGDTTACNTLSNEEMAKQTWEEEAKAKWLSKLGDPASGATATVEAKAASEIEAKAKWLAKVDASQPPTPALAPPPARAVAVDEATRDSAPAVEGSAVDEATRDSAPAVEGSVVPSVSSLGSEIPS